MLLLRCARVYGPAPLGLKDILIEGERIARIGDDLSRFAPLCDEVWDLGGAAVTPGLIDAHIHITGGGGEQGPASRCPECPVSELLRNGVTTVLGLLGTDGLSRSLENLLYKTKALNEEGVSAYMLTGAYQYPSPTLTGSVLRDIALISEIIGCKLALSDHRSANVTAQELIRLASDVRSGGLISGKAGVLTVHMGSGAGRLAHILTACRETDIPVKTFWPTHMGRTPALLEEGLEFMSLGGTIDITASSDPARGAAKKIAALLARGADPGRITLSSDAFGSQPRFDSRGQCIGLDYVSPSVDLANIRSLIADFGVAPEIALGLMTVNPARMMGLSGKKGEIAPGADADLIVMTPGWQIDSVLAKGRIALRKGELLMKGRFE